MSEYIIDWDENLVVDTFSKNSLREEIVRCRDCKHADEVETRYAGIQYGCLRFDDTTVEPDGFCAWGERRVP